MIILGVLDVNIAILIVIVIKILFLICKGLYFAFFIVPRLLSNKHMWYLEKYNKYIGEKVEIYMNNNDIINCEMIYISAILYDNVNIVMMIKIHEKTELMCCSSNVITIKIRDMKQYSNCLNEILLKKNIPFEIRPNIIKYL